MIKDLQISYLLDFYGTMLTDKQRNVISMYYNEDLSLSEIAENCGISRQGVRDSIKRAEAQLYELEEKLSLAAKFKTIEESLAEIKVSAEKIKEIAEKDGCDSSISMLGDNIISLAKYIEDSGF